MFSRLVHCIALTLLLAASTYAQKSIVKKANKEFNSYDYIDAREIYLKVAQNGYESPQLFENLGDTYYFNSNYTEALTWYKKLLDRFPNETKPVYYYRTAQSLKSTGNYQESKKVMGKYAGLSASSRIAEIFMNDYNTLDSLADFESKKYEILNVTQAMEGSDFGPSFMGNKLVYASSSNGAKGNKVHNWSGLPYVDLYEAEIDEEWKLKNPEPLKGEINSPLHESTATFSKDGNTVYFTRNNYLDGKKKRGKQKLVSLKVFKATKDEQGNWGNIQELPFNNDSYSVAHPALSTDGKRLYFSSNMAGSLGLSDLWYVDILGDSSYGTPVNLGPEINTEARETFPFISDSNTLYFSSDGHLGLGGLDIFVTDMNEENTAKQIINLKQPINTKMDDFGYIMDEAKQIGYFSSNREGKAGSASDDIYRVWETCGEITAVGTITDANTSNPIYGATVFLLDSNNAVLEETIADADGNYHFTQILDCSMQYTVRAQHEIQGYDPMEKIINTPRGTEELSIDIALSYPDCADNDLGCRLNLQPIYFDYGRYTIREDAEVELAKILEALKQYPQIKIHIESHTDSRSSDSFNMRLSQKRANSTLEWLIANGIPKNRLSSEGYGETQLLNNCSNGVDCSEAAHQLNRRSVFVITE